VGMANNDLPDHAGLCPDCGAQVTGGQEGCQALFDEFFSPARGNLVYAGVRELAFDAYCMQHLERYCRSAKSYAAHLTRLCYGLEYQGQPRVYAAIQKWLNGSVPLQKPDLLPFLGKMTVADIRAAETVDGRLKLVRAWAESVWEAYESQHGLARNWLAAALARAK
jgi:hypothetical protein